VGQGWLRAEGVLLQPLGEAWAAYSSASGETHLINESGAALIQALDEREPRHRKLVQRNLAAAADLTDYEVDSLLKLAWEEYLQAGLLRRSGVGVDPLEDDPIQTDPPR
jgi:hypothetical protein